jgi:hypothetical protein
VGERVGRGVCVSGVVQKREEGARKCAGGSPDGPGQGRQHLQELAGLQHCLLLDDHQEALKTMAAYHLGFPVTWSPPPQPTAPLPSPPPPSST